MRRVTVHRMSFEGQLLERGFWLYVCRIRSSKGLFLYVGRTGDSSSQHAGSPFDRVGRHLDFRPQAKGNSMVKRLREQGIAAAKCRFEMIAIGPLFSEQKHMEAHKPLRDKTAALEKHIASALKARGYKVIGIHAASKGADDPVLCRAILYKLHREFPNLHK